MASHPDSSPSSNLHSTDRVCVTDICVSSDQSQPSKLLEIRLDNERKPAHFVGDSSRSDFRWIFDPSVVVRPKATFSVQIHRHRKLHTFRRREKAALIEIPTEHMLDANAVLKGERCEYVRHCNGFTITIGMSSQLFPASKEIDQDTGLQAPKAVVPGLFISPEDVFSEYRSDISSVLGDFGWSLNYLTGFIKIVEGLAEIHPAALAAVKILAIAYGLLQNEKKFNGELQDLGIEIRGLLSHLAEAESRAKIESLKDTVVSMIKAIREAAEFTEDYLRKNALEKLWAAQFRQSKLTEFKKLFARLASYFGRSVNIQVMIDVYQVAKSSAWIEEENVLINRLKPTSCGGYPECMDGTREAILKEIYDWLDTSDSSNFLWITGSPGAGKTAISATVVSYLIQKGRLGARFFFKQGDASLGDPTSVWRTAAYELAKFHTGARRSVVEALKNENVDGLWGDIDSVFTQLIVAPLASNQNNYFGQFPVIVLDALDECDYSQTRHWLALLNSFKKWSTLPPSFKLVITSRPEDRIARSLSGIGRHIELLTGDRSNSETMNDIRYFIQKRLSDISEQYPDSLSPTWAPPAQIDKFVIRAAGLFIWAETAMKYIEQSSDPEQRLAEVIAGELGKKGADIGRLYSKILKATFENDNDAAAFRAIVGTIILAKVPLSRQDLQHLLPRWIKAISLDIILAKLRSVITVGDYDKLFRISHQTFADFLLDDNQCPEAFAIDRVEHSCSLSQGCLRLMNSSDGLKFNICHLETSHLFNDEVSDLPQRIMDNIPSHLIYSCRFWANHLRDMRNLTLEDHNMSTLLKDIKYFLRIRVLYWLEVMSLIKEFDTASVALRLGAQWIEAFDRELAMFAVDISKFAVTFRDPISMSAPHIYISALPFSPSGSEVSKQFLPKFPRLLSVDKGRSTAWPALHHVFRGHNQAVYYVVFSPDGGRIASCSKDKTIIIWDTETGDTVVGPLDGHSDVVLSISFSPDGKRLASGSQDKTIRIWDAETGDSIAGPFEGHSKGVLCLVYTSDGKRLVSSSRDRTIRVWDIETGDCVVGPFIGHSLVIYRIALSPDDKRVVSCSADHTIGIWDAETGEVLIGPFTAHPEAVYTVAISPDGKHIVSCSEDKTICIWDVETGDRLAGPYIGHTDCVLCVKFSPDGRHIVSCSEDRTIRILDAKTGDCVAEPYEGHGATINTVAFSPDGKRLVSCSSDSTVRVWDVVIGTSETKTFEQHIAPVEAVVFSPDGKRLLSGSKDKTIRVWDAEACNIIFEPIRGHTAAIFSVAFSPDGKRLVSGSRDKTIRIWDSETGDIVAGPFEGHTDFVFSVAFSPNGKRVVSGSKDKSIYIWDVELGTHVVGPFGGDSAMIYSVAFSPNGKRVISGANDRTVRIWDAETGDSVGKIFEGHLSGVFSVAFSPDGTRIASGSNDDTIRIWDSETGETVTGPLEGHIDTVLSVAFSPDGKRVVSGSIDKTIRIWEIETGSIVTGPLMGHSHTIGSVAFSPDGKRVISGSDDNTIRIWKVEEGIKAANIFGEHASSMHNTEICSSDFDAVNEVGSFAHSPLIEGWIRGPNSEALFWIPAVNRMGLWRPQNTVVIGTSVTRLDFRRFVHGLSWVNCHFS